MTYQMTEREKARADLFRFKQTMCKHLTLPRDHCKHYWCNEYNHLIGDPFNACRGCKKMEMR